MRHSAAIGIAVYVALVGGVIGGAYAAFEAVVGAAPAQTASLGVVKQGPGFPTSRKWTPVEIKREVAELPPLPAYVTPSSAARARVAKNVQKRVVVVAQTGRADIRATDGLLCAGSIGLRAGRRAPFVWPVQFQVLTADARIPAQGRFAAIPSATGHSFPVSMHPGKGPCVSGGDGR